MLKNREFLKILSEQLSLYHLQVFKICCLQAVCLNGVGVCRIF